MLATTGGDVLWTLGTRPTNFNLLDVGNIMLHPTTFLGCAPCGRSPGPKHVSKCR
jgi:hypothetical protein